MFKLLVRFLKRGLQGGNGGIFGCKRDAHLFFQHLNRFLLHIHWSELEMRLESHVSIKVRTFSLWSLFMLS